MKSSFFKYSVFLIFLSVVLSMTGCVYGRYGYSDGYWEDTPGHGYPYGYYRYYDDDDDHYQYKRYKKYDKDDSYHWQNNDGKRRWFDRGGGNEWRNRYRDNDDRNDSDRRSSPWRSFDRFRFEDRKEDRH